MAFPAYSTSTGEAQIRREDREDEDWLHCSSFTPSLNVPVETKKKKHKSRHKSKKSSKRENFDELQVSSSSKYEIDLKPVPQIKCTLSSGASKSEDSKVKKRRPKKSKKSSERYFAKEQELTTAEEKLDPDEYIRRTKEFNVLLRTNPESVDTWCQYVQLQDKGEGLKRGIASKKLSIVEKALEHNSSSDVLLTMKLNLMEELYPYDKVVNEARVLASKHSSSKVGWRWLISSTLFSLTRLTAPGLVNHFGSMLDDITKRGGQPKFVLDVLMEVGLFLRHASLWELLWTLVEQYLEICFTTIGSSAFKVTVDLPEREIENVEDGIMTSGLPLHALWIRTEHLRSCVHFLPTIEETGDHQRLILPEDVAPLLFPITPDLSTKLCSASLILFKVPPLPCTDAFVSFTGLDKIPWHLESSEILLSAQLSFAVVQHDCSYLEDLKELAVPPQYVKESLGHETFLEAVEKMFDHIANHCTSDRINFLVWEIRWWRYCVKIKSLTGPKAKRFLSKAKAILKKERTALPIYTEYALLEEAAGNVDSCLKVMETAINLQEPGLLASSIEKQHIFALYRAYIEVLLRNQIADYREKMLRLLIAMAYGEKLDIVKVVTTDLTMKALQRFEHVSTELFADLNAEDSASLEDVIHGSADMHWLACHGWFHFTQHKVLPKFLSCLTDIGKAPILSENLMLLKVDILSRMRQVDPLTFDHKSFADLVAEGCARYPNNTALLHVLSSIKCDGVRWSKISSSLVSSGSPIAAMFFILISKQRLFSRNSTQTGAETKMYSILRKCVESKNLERCPILRRLILQYVSCTLDENVVEQEYHKAVEKCPWVKILYYEAANQVPKLLGEIQDLLTEKELRIHVTPEELEILRESAPPENSVSQKEDELTVFDGELNKNLQGESEECDHEVSEKIVEQPGSTSVGEAPDFADCSLNQPPRLSSGTSESDESISSSDSEQALADSCNKPYSPTVTSDESNSSSDVNQHFKVDSPVQNWDDPGPNLCTWDESRLLKARDSFHAKRAAKRSLDEICDTKSEFVDPPDESKLKQSHPSSEMSKLEEIETAKLVEDSCQDVDAPSDYTATDWSKEKLKAIREKWESKRKKL